MKILTDYVARAPWYHGKPKYRLVIEDSELI